jgi:hypothetical protein
MLVSICGERAQCLAFSHRRQPRQHLGSEFATPRLDRGRGGGQDTAAEIGANIALRRQWLSPAA